MTLSQALILLLTPLAQQRPMAVVDREQMMAVTWVAPHRAPMAAIRHQVQRQRRQSQSPWSQCESHQSRHRQWCLRRHLCLRLQKSLSHGGEGVEDEGEDVGGQAMAVVDLATTFAKSRSGQARMAVRRLAR